MKCLSAVVAAVLFLSLAAVWPAHAEEYSKEAKNFQSRYHMHSDVSEKKLEGRKGESESFWICALADDAAQYIRDNSSVEKVTFAGIPVEKAGIQVTGRGVYFQVKIPMLD